MRLVLVRHGQTDSNVISALDTALPGADLNDTGRFQARSFAERWDEVVGGKVHTVGASTVLRTQQTAAPLAAAQSTELVIQEGFREIQAGDLEMRNDREAIEEYLGTIIAWAGGDLDRRMPGGESGQEVLDRFDAALVKLLAPLDSQATAVVFSHGAVIRFYSAQRLAGLEIDWIAKYPVYNTSLALAEGNLETGWEAKMWASRPVEHWRQGITDYENHYLANPPVILRDNGA